MINMEAIPKFDIKSVIKSDIKFDISTKLTTWIGHKVAIAKFIGKMQKKSGIMKSWLVAMPLILLDDLLRLKTLHSLPARLSRIRFTKLEAEICT